MAPFNHCRRATGRLFTKNAGDGRLVFPYDNGSDQLYPGLRHVRHLRRSGPRKNPHKTLVLACQSILFARLNSVQLVVYYVRSPACRYRYNIVDSFDVLL